MDYIDNAWKVFENNFAIKVNESVLIVTDDKLENIASYFYEAVKNHQHEVSIIKIPAIYKSGEEPPKAVVVAMASVDIVLCITSASLTHTLAKVKACESGARVGTMPGLTLEMLEGGAITADPDEVVTLTDKYTKLLDESSNVKIVKADTELTFSISQRKGISSTGLITVAGSSGNIPSGESFIAPIEDSANGQIVIDGSIAGIGIITEPVKLTIKDGRLIEATGSVGAQLLEFLGDENGRIIAEFGIGTNTSARLTGAVLEDEKVFGTIHIAFGSNKPFGGTNEASVHIDCVVTTPQVWLDNQLLELK